LLAEVLDPKLKGKCSDEPVGATFDWLAGTMKEVAVQPVATNGVPTCVELENDQSLLPIFNSR